MKKGGSSCMKGGMKKSTMKKRGGMNCGPKKGGMNCGPKKGGMKKRTMKKRGGMKKGSMKKRTAKKGGKSLLERLGIKL